MSLVQSSYWNEGALVIDIGRSGIFGNPWKITATVSRQEAVENYALYFLERVKIDPEFRMAVQKLAQHFYVLSCPGCRGTSPCHADVIRYWLAR